MYGASRGVQNLLYLSLGTGIAAGLIIEGRLYRGTHGMVGEIGHTSFLPDGPLCRCGGRGCLEAMAAGPALAHHAQVALEAGRTSLLQDGMADGAQVTAERVFAAAWQGDELALEVLTTAAEQIARAIYLLSMLFDPQVVVLGGGLALEDGPLSAAIRAEVARLLEQAPMFREIFSPDMLVLSSLKRDGGILGAAALFAMRPTGGASE
jgi:glucokinase